MYTIDIDVGGTFTDGFFTDGRALRTEKVVTTPYDLTECFMSCIDAGARAFGCAPREFLKRTAAVRVSTTAGTNLLVQRSGPKIGLLATAGEEERLYGEGSPAILGSYLSPELCAGVREAVDDRGEVREEVQAEEMLAAVRRLVNTGARMIVVSFRNAWRNPWNERRVRALVRERYPVHYLRSVPLQLATEVAHVADDHARTNAAILNAYIHGDMARALYRVEDKLRAAGYDRPLLVVHASGGCARVAKTVALHTLHSGPVAAAKGAAFVARQLGLSRVLTGDMGGTSFDMSLVIDGAVAFAERPRIEGIAVGTPMIEVDSLGAGGGSIARIANGELRVGPDSAGSSPGPACYGKGGMEPTVTDANLVLGYIASERFLGGRMRLDLEAARRALQRRIARPLGIGVEEAAYRVRERITQEMAAQMVARLRARDLAPGDFTLFSIGGAGPLHACAIGARAALAAIIAFPYGSVFSAFGSSTVDVRHLYTVTLDVPGEETGVTERGLRRLQAQAVADMRGEGFEDDRVRFELGIIHAAPEPSVTTVATDLAAEELIPALSRLLQSAGPGARVQGLRLSVVGPIVHWQPEARALMDTEAAGALVGRRPVYWRAEEATMTPVYERPLLAPGNMVSGPAIIEGGDTVYPVAAGWRVRIDACANLVFERC